MKKLLAIILVCAMLLTACGKSGESDEIRQISWWSNFCNDGALLLEQIEYNGQVLKFIDFNTMQQAVICPRPNCMHNDPETCSAYGMDNCPILYGSNIFFFATEADYQKDTLKIMRANTDGTGRVTMKTIEERDSPYYDVRYLIGSTLYFTTVKRNFNDTGSTSYQSYYLCSYDLDTNEYTEIALIIEGHYSGTRLMGVYDGKLYIDASRATVQEEIPWQNFMDPNFTLEYTDFNQYYDLETGELHDTDLFVFYADGKYLATGSKDESECLIYREDGSTIDVSDLRTVYDIVNDKLFARTKGVVVDLKTGKRYKMLTDYSVIYCIDGEYILQHDLIDENGYGIGTEYFRVTEDEIIGEEID